jgi:predicted Zn-ribbon and HTH transcriptional regulator
MILDDAIECPRCGKSVKLVDPVTIAGRTVMYLCSVCAEKPADRQIDKSLVHFRQLVKGISSAVDKHCAQCSGAGWNFLGGGRALRMRKCPACAATGIDMQELLKVLEIGEKPRPEKRGPAGDLFPGREIGKGRSH